MLLKFTQEKHLKLLNIQWRLAQLAFKLEQSVYANETSVPFQCADTKLDLTFIIKNTASAKIDLYKSVHKIKFWSIQRNGSTGRTLYSYACE